MVKKTFVANNDGCSLDQPMIGRPADQPTSLQRRNPQKKSVLLVIIGTCLGVLLGAPIFVAPHDAMAPIGR